MHPRSSIKSKRRQTETQLQHTPGGSIQETGYLQHGAKIHLGDGAADKPRTTWVQDLHRRESKTQTHTSALEGSKYPELSLNGAPGGGVDGARVRLIRVINGY